MIDGNTEILQDDEEIDEKTDGEKICFQLRRDFLFRHGPQSLAWQQRLRTCQWLDTVLLFYHTVKLVVIQFSYEKHLSYSKVLLVPCASFTYCSFSVPQNSIITILSYNIKTMRSIMLPRRNSTLRQRQLLMGVQLLDDAARLARVEYVADRPVQCGVERLLGQVVPQALRQGPREARNHAVLAGEHRVGLRAGVPAGEGDDVDDVRVGDEILVEVVHVGQRELEHELLVAAKRLELGRV